ncbi:Adenylate kinase 9 [Brachionus plicatilis]|uniref:Adenylate kinase 9 n=1 Tax=Brachionus plicatilis TaxID=10195 RepID=A0A3M7QUE5_BRAPC|nr:Adenylate kinase 9 [Brachionus plicatilis]
MSKLYHSSQNSKIINKKRKSTVKRLFGKTKLAQTIYHLNSLSRLQTILVSEFYQKVYLGWMSLTHLCYKLFLSIDFSNIKIDAELKKVHSIEMEIKEEDENAEKESEEDPKLLEKIVEEDELRDRKKLDEKKSSIKSSEPGYPLKGPETQEFLNKLKPILDTIKGIQNSVSTITGSDPSFIDINKKSSEPEKSIEDLAAESANIVEKIFQFRAIDFDGIDEEEPEENDEEEEEKEEEEEEEFEDVEEEGDENIFDPSLREKKISFGETSHYCPVALYSKYTLVPGNPEIQCKYRERFYRFSSEDAKKEFMDNPLKYLPNSRRKLKMPPPRILVLGPRGSGKSTQARFLAEKLNLFHVKFRDYLQELIIGKTKKKIDYEREEDKEEEDQPDDDEDDEEEKKFQYHNICVLKEEKNSEPLPELTEREETIKAYLEKDEVLPTEIMDEILPQLWNEEPYRSRGFVLEGFPNNDSQAHYLMDKGFFPDAVIILRVEDEDVVKRLLPERLESWRAKMNAKKERKMQKAKRKKEKLLLQMKQRREEEIAKYEENRQKKEEEDDFVNRLVPLSIARLTLYLFIKKAAENGEEYEDDEEFDVDALIQDEFADQLQEEEDVEEAQEDEVKENMINDIKARFDNELSYLDLVKNSETTIYDFGN